MNYANFKDCDRELHAAYHRAKFVGDRDAMLDVERQRDELYRGATYEYEISDRMLIYVRVQLIAICIGARRLDRGVNLVSLPRWELEGFNAAELRTLADLRELVQRYEDGDLQELPPSGKWTP